jgi:ribosome maturation factor RimP
MSIPLPDLAEEVRARLERMGFEVVEARWVGSPRRPIFRIKMDLPDSVPGEGGVSVDQCAAASRELEPWFDAHPDVPERYVLEVSSPGVERPLVRKTDWERFKGHPVMVKGKGFPGPQGNRVEGDLMGLAEDEQGEMVVVRTEQGHDIRIPLDRITEAHLLFRWD